MQLRHDESTVEHVYMVFVGDAGSGKSSIVRLLTLDSAAAHAYARNYEPTAGVQLHEKWLPLGTDSLHLVILDCSGRDIFEQQVLKSIPCPSNGGSSAPLACVVFDVTSQRSFEAAQRWISLLKPMLNSSKKCIGILIANKIDLSHRRVTSEAFGRKFAHDNRMTYVELSTKDGAHILPAFKQLLAEFRGK